ncbi:MAG: hypothetical protein V4550_09145 [Gemmatimonadota bacterium]
MQIDDLIARYPRLYHMAEDGSWASIKRDGLLSTRALLDHYEVDEKTKARLYSHHRPESVTLSHPAYGRAVVRDQKPMDDRGLERALGGALTPRAWYELLNDRVFFWLTEERLTRLLGARAYRSRQHTVLTLDSAPLIRKYAARITLSPINSGCTKPMPQPRGLSTFRRVADYPFDAMLAKRGARGDPIVELAIDSGVGDIAQYVIRVEQRRGPEVLEVLLGG